MLGAILNCSDGEWVISYNEQSPFCAFEGRQVIIFGQPSDLGPESQQFWFNGMLGHFNVSTLRLVEVTPDAKLVEIIEQRNLLGQFKCGTSDTGKTALSFVTEDGDTFLVANDPAGATVGRNVNIRSYPVHMSPSDRRPSDRCLWVICPCSIEDLWEWRGRRSLGLENE